MTKLDASQLSFCKTPAQNLRLLAPAGCGKTLSLLHRCAHLVASNAATKQRVLVVTFTVAARAELKKRLDTDPAFQGLGDHVEITTLNSWGNRRLKSLNFSVRLLVEKKDVHFAVKNQLAPVWGRHERVKSAIQDSKKGKTPREVMESIDSFKSMGFDHTRHNTLDSFRKQVDVLCSQGLDAIWEAQVEKLQRLDILEPPLVYDEPEERDEVGQVYQHFFGFWREAVENLAQSATFTLEDQKYFGYLDEKGKLEEGKFLSGAAQSHHVMVDEFQDINPLDLALIKAIVARNRATLTVVGDDDQAIFEWRGATPEYILKPDKHFGATFETHILKTNYRSPANIVERSRRLIEHNLNREAKDFQPAHSMQAEIKVIETEGVLEALDLVHKQIAALKDSERLAVIARKKYQLIPYQVYFASKEIPFCAAEDLQVFLGAAFDGLVSILLLKTRAGTSQPKAQIVSDTMTLCDLVKKYPLSKKDGEGLRRYLQDGKPATMADAADLIAGYTGPIKGSTNGSISCSMAAAIRGFLESKTVSDTLIQLGEDFGGLQQDIGKAEDDIFYSDPPFTQLADYAVKYGDDFGLFVDDIENAKSQLVRIPPFDDEIQASTEDVWQRPVHLMTALRAKGKEFDTVVLLDVNDGMWPTHHADTLPKREAERRVFYVAFTRAKKKVVMLVSEQLRQKPATPSPYLAELGLVVP